MKKIVTILALAMVLCLACGVASAAVNYASGYKFIRNNTIIHFQGATPDEFEDYNFTMDELEYNYDLSKLTFDADFRTDSTKRDLKIGTDVVGKIISSGDCTVDFWIELVPSNDVGLRTNNPKDTGRKGSALPTDKGLGYFGYEATMAVNKVVTAAELKSVNKNLYKALIARDHQYEYEAEMVTEATCTDSGEAIPVCKVCKLKGDKITLAAKGHTNDLTDTNKTTLIADGAVTVGGKTYTLTKAPNCSEKGTYVGYCTTCEDEKAVFELDKKDTVHEFGEWQPEIAATCTKEGLSYRLCKLCLEAKEYKNTAALGHDWVYDIITEANCDPDATKGFGIAKSATCARCNKVLKKSTWGDFTDAEKKDANGEAITLDGDNLKLAKDPNNHPKEYWKFSSAAADGYKGASCTKTGLDVYKCGLCNKVANKTVTPAKGHKLTTYYAPVDKYNTKGEWIKEDAFAGCKEDAAGKPIQYVKITICAGNKDANDAVVACPTYPMEAAALADRELWELVPAVDHDWSAWTMRNEPSDKTPGYWIRECNVCHKHDEYIGYTAPSNGTDPTKPTKSGLQLEEDGTVQLYVDGKPSTASGVYAYNGGRFAVVNGKVDTSINGAVVTSATECLFFANGQVQESYNGFALYDGQWFVVENGKVNTGYNGLYEYNGGTFLVAAGRGVKEYNGLWQNTDGTWYLMSNGQVFWTDTEVEYDGATFTVKGGKVVA